MVIAFSVMDYECPGRFETFEDACRMAWHGHMHQELLGYKTPKPEIDRMVAKFQRNGKL